MHEGSSTRIRAEQDVDQQLADHLILGFTAKPGKTQFKREKVLYHGPVPFEQRPADDEILKEFWIHMVALNHSLKKVVAFYYR